MSHDSQENQTIRYEKTDTNNRAIVILGLVVLAVLFGISLLMIPFTKYLWDQAGHSNSFASERPAQPDTAVPEILVEVHPGSELAKFHAEMTAAEADNKINAAIQDSLKQGFPSRKAS